MELDFASDMFDLHHKVSPNEVIVGWWSTGSDIIDHSLLIHDYYKRVVDNPIHITVDTTLQNGKLDYKVSIVLFPVFSVVLLNPLSVLT